MYKIALCGALAMSSAFLLALLPSSALGGDCRNESDGRVCNCTDIGPDDDHTCTPERWDYDQIRKDTC